MDAEHLRTFKAIIEKVDTFFSDETIRKKFDKAFEESIMSPGYVVSNSFFSALRKQLELETLKTKLTDIRNAYGILNFDAEKDKIETDLEFYRGHKDNIDKYLDTGIKKINEFIKKIEDPLPSEDDHATLRLKQIVKRIDMNVG